MLSVVNRTMERILESVQRLNERVESLNNEVSDATSTISKIEVECSAQKRTLWLNLKSVVEKTRKYGENIAEITKRQEQLHDISEGLQNDPPYYQPLVNELKQSFGKVKQHYSEFFEACSISISDLDKAVELDKLKAREAENRRATQSVGRRAAGAVVAGAVVTAGATVVVGVGTDVVISVVTTVFGFGIGTVVGLGLTVAGALAGGQLVEPLVNLKAAGAADITYITDEFENLEEAFSQLKAIFISLRQTTSRMQLQVQGLLVNIEEIDEILTTLQQSKLKQKS